MTEVRLRVGEMDCPSCVAKIERHLVSVRGVRDVQGAVLSRMLVVTVDAGALTEGDIRREVGRLGYSTESLEPDERPAPPPSPWRTRQAHRAYAAAGLMVVGGAIRLLTRDPLLWSGPLLTVSLSGGALILAAVVGGWNFFPKGLASARRLSLDMNFLMTVAIIGAVLLGELVEAAAIAVLFSLAELLETYSVDRARRSIESLMELAPQYAVVVRDGVEVTVPASSVRVGETVIVRPGDRIPTDGTVLEGISAVDQSPITGESLPVDKQPDDVVLSGTINRDGWLRIRVDKPADRSALANIVRLVEEAEASKTRSERFVERFARWYTPAVTVAAVLVAVAPPLLLDASATLWITRGLTLLVIACPCALVISTPVAVVSGVTAAARHGVLIKGGAHLETLGETPVFALDKTGTLTVGHPVVRSVVPVVGDGDEALARAAAVERRSRHPLARAIVEEARRRGLDPTAEQVDDFEALPGKGARARIGGIEYLVGRPALFPDTPVPPGLDEAGHSVVGVGRDGSQIAWITLADQAREEARRSIAELRRLGVDRVVMLTGDRAATADAVAAELGVDEVHADLLPEDKLRLLGELKARHGAVAMVGDGVNDGPALAAATVGIAMGAAGSDTALETADVALMGDHLDRLPYLVRLSRRARAVIRQNIAASILIKAVLAIGVPLGFVSLITAVVVGDLGVSLAVTLNALRLGRVGE